MPITIYGNAQGTGQGMPAGSTGTYPQQQMVPQQQPQFIVPPQPQQQQPQYQYQPMPAQQYQQPVAQPYQAEVIPQYQTPPMQQQQQPPSTVYGQQAPTQVTPHSDMRMQLETFVTAAGVSTSQVEQELSLTGTVSELTRQALVRKHGEGTTNLIVGNMQTMHTQAQAALSATNTAIFSQVEQAFNGIATPGQTGEQSWKELATWVASNVTKDMRDAYNAMLNNGGVQAQLAVTQMIDAFKKANGVGQPADLLLGNGGQQAPTGEVGINDMTVGTYTVELEKLVDKFGYESPQVAALNAKRDAARARGIY
jgi:hypothetical protein